MSSSAGVDKRGQTLTVRVPLPPRRRGGRKFILGPGGSLRQVPEWSLTGRSSRHWFERIVGKQCWRAATTLP
jgi:hypothetical protein